MEQEVPCCCPSAVTTTCACCSRRTSCLVASAVPGRTRVPTLADVLVGPAVAGRGPVGVGEGNFVVAGVRPARGPSRGTDEAVVVRWGEMTLVVKVAVVVAVVVVVVAAASRACTRARMRVPTLGLSGNGVGMAGGTTPDTSQHMCISRYQTEHATGKRKKAINREKDKTK